MSSYANGFIGESKLLELWKDSSWSRSIDICMLSHFPTEYCDAAEASDSKRTKSVNTQFHQHLPSASTCCFLTGMLTWKVSFAKHPFQPPCAWKCFKEACSCGLLLLLFKWSQGHDDMMSWLSSLGSEACLDVPRMAPAPHGVDLVDWKGALDESLPLVDE